MNSDLLTIDDVGPMPIERPATVAELCAIVRRCADSGTAIYPFGGGTMLDYGMPPARPGIALATGNLNQVIDYPARDMTITIQAGITMQTLQDALAAEGQWLPIDVPDPEHATIGGAIACDVSGPRRYGYGTLRDYVIGITVVNDRGEECKAGGRVVKNVAGYDLMKLYTGSLGTLGVITQVTLKVRPKPEAFEDMRLETTRGRFIDVLERLEKLSSRPISVTVDNVGIGCFVFVEFAGSRDAVDWQLEQFRREVEPIGLSPGRKDMPLAFDCELNVKVVPSQLMAFCRHLFALDSTSWLKADVGTGACKVYLSSRNSQPFDRVTQFLDEIARTVQKSGGRMIIQRCPLEWKSSINVWSRPPADIGLEMLIRAKFDPKRIFNPGRFVTDVF